MGFCRNYFKAKTSLTYPELGLQDMGDNKDKESKKEEAAMQVHNVLPRNKRGKSSGSGANREWEVGKPGYDEYDDARRLKR